MRIKNPSKNNELKVLVETLKKKNIITDEDIKTTKQELKQIKGKKITYATTKKEENK